MTVTESLSFEGKRVFFCFSERDMKDKRARKFLISAKLFDPLREYLERFRPALMRDRTNCELWIGRSGRALSKDGLACHLKDVTNKHLGLGLRPHAFRHIAATSIAEFDPKHVGIIRDVLGHSTLEMAERHYNRASAISSCNDLQSVISTLKRKGQPGNPSKR